MKTRVALGGLALAVLAGMTMPAQAAPITGDVPPRRADIDRPPVRLDGIKNLPRGLQPDKRVSALVQLSGDPVAVQRTKAKGTVRTFDELSAQRTVRRTQDAALPKLEAAGASVYGQLDTVLNAVQVRVKVSDLDKVAAVPGVRGVQVSRTITLDNAKGEQFTGVDQIWQDRKLTGKGQVIGIIDGGVDYTHADFGGAGTPAAYQANNSAVIEPGTFPTAKVTGGYDFVGDAYDPDPDGDEANAVPKPDSDPLDCRGHGSHVAGTAAGIGVNSDGTTYRGSYTKATLKRSFRVAPGAAPQAGLKAYKVFGCEGGATDDIVTAAIDRAVSDGVDVINLSLGSDLGTRNDLGNQAVTNATEAGVLVVTAAGNAGPGAYLVGSPSTADAALSVAAVGAEFTHFPGVSITGAAQSEGILANEATVRTPITGGLVDLGLGCDAAAYAAAVGKIALTTRGACARTDRARFGQAAGALAVIMINDTEGLPPLEGPIAGVTIPFIGVAGTAGAALIAAAGKTVTIAAGPAIRNPDYGRVADFSSAGPRRLDNAPKPDVAAPGVSVPSAAVGTGTGSVRQSGTSMSAPLTAGAAALVRQAHPTWSPERAKAVIMSTASPTAVKGFDSQQVGTGLIQPRLATASQAYAWTRSGLNSLRFGMNQLSGSHSETKSFKITNASKRTVTYDLSRTFSSQSYGADITIRPTKVSVKAGKTATIRVGIKLSAPDVAKLPGAEANENGDLVSLRGLIVAKPRSPRTEIVTLRTAFLLVPVPLSSVKASPTVTQTPAGELPPITVRNSGVHEGTADVYQWLLSDPAGDVADNEVADLTNVGVQSLLPPGGGTSDRLLVFAASQARGTSTQSTHEIDLSIDTDGDGKADFVTFAVDTGLLTDGAVDGTMSSFTYDVKKDAVVDAWSASAPANGSTVLLPVLASSLGLNASSKAFGVSATGYSVVSDGVDKVQRVGRFNAFAPALSQGDLVTVAPGGSASIPVGVDEKQVAQQTAAGWLVVTPDDKSGYAETDRVALKLSGPPPAPAVQAPLVLTKR